MGQLRTGLVGWPVAHSLSPKIHEYWLFKHGLKASYELFATEPSKLADIAARLRTENIRGVNVTVPHKEKIIYHLDAMDRGAKQIGAVNTITQRDGRLYGTNTDAYGFITNLKQGLGELTPYIKKVVVLGAGGASRAIIVALQEANAKSIVLSNRTAEAAELLAEDFGVATHPWEKRNDALADATLLINATSLGMKDKPPLEIDLSALPKSAAVHDIVYAPLETEILKNARLRGHPAVDGLGMLLYQAQRAFEQWHGVLPQVTDELRQRVLSPS